MAMSSPKSVQTPPQSESLSQLVGRIAHALDVRLPPGDLSALRRLRSEDPSCLAFWKLVADFLEPQLPPDGPSRDEAERRWRVILSAMAELKGLHQPRHPLGTALAEAEYSELRLLRLLRARAVSLGDSVRTLAHFMASKASPFNQADIARLVLSDGRRDQMATRRRIARAYYGATKPN